MRSTVTVILVANQGGAWLSETISGIQAQTRVPATIVAVNNGGGSRVDEQLRDRGIERILAIQARTSYGRAVAEAVATLQPLGGDATPWLWLLTEDSCPDHDALDELLSRVERAPSIVVAGPKLVDWDRPDHIIELGESLTKRGSRWLLRRQELDQQQYDHLQDVLAVGPVGMLVRRDVWDDLQGFDPAYTAYDDGLDFSVRARLAGHRVEVAPEARVRFARSGVGGPKIDRSRKVLRSAHRQARTAHLHRRIAYAPAPVAVVLWLGLPLLSILRVAWALIREQPGNMIGEFVAAWTVFFRPRALLQSRKRIKRASTLGWASIRGLRIDQKTVRTTRMIDREAILAAQGRSRKELHFISTGGLAVLVALSVAAIALTWWAIPQTNLIGGGMTPLSSFAELWRNTRMIDGVPADPFTWVLAVIGSITFWNPSHAIVLLVIVSIPLTGLGAWIWAAHLTDSRAGRTITAVGFALSPVLLGSIAAGRLTTLILAIVLPWLLLAASRCRESWSWAGTASLLAAVALACAPILIPVAVVFFVIGIFSSVRGVTRVLSVAIAPLVLFAPNIVFAILRGSPLDVFMDPGAVSPFTPGTTWHLLLGFPEFGLEGWGRIFETIGLGGAPATLLVGILMLPLALLALLGLYTGRIAITILSSLLGGLGMLTAIVSTHLVLTTTGNVGVSIWTGSGLALYWLAIVTLAAIGAETIGRVAPSVVTIALVTAMVAVGPLMVTLGMARTPIAESKPQMPAIVQAAGEGDAATRTLVITAEGEREVRAEVVTGAGQRMDQLRSASFHDTPTAEDEQIAELVGALMSVGDATIDDRLTSTGVGFVLLAEGGNASEDAAMQRIFEQHPALLSAGSTDQGLLWRVSDTVVASGDLGDEGEVLAGTSLTGHTVWIIQLVVLLGMLLLALPTGEVVERPERRQKPSKKPGNTPSTKPGTTPGGTSGDTSGAEPGMGAAVESPQDVAQDPEESGESEGPGGTGATPLEDETAAESEGSGSEDSDPPLTQDVGGAAPDGSESATSDTDTTSDTEETR